MESLQSEREKAVQELIVLDMEKFGRDKKKIVREKVKQMNEAVTDSLEKQDREIRLTQVVFHGDLDVNKIYQARIRYRQKLQECTLKKSADGELLVRFETPQLSVSKGQSCVIYNGDFCVGGGVIE
jgi:tRNA-specific 2-thiouridylase